MLNVEIRNADETDLVGLQELETRSFETDRQSRRSLRRFLRSNGARLRVAATDGGLCGYHLLLFRKGSAVARLYSIAVAKARRRAGIASLLMADAEAIAGRRGCRALRLEVRPDNPAAIRLYERLGYRRIGIRQQYYADGADAIRYERTIGPATAPTADDEAEVRSPPTIDALQSGAVAPITPTASVLAAKV